MGLPTYKSLRMNSNVELCGPAALKIDLEGGRVEICKRRQVIEEVSVPCLIALSFMKVLVHLRSQLSTT